MELRAGIYIFECYPMPWSVYELGCKRDCYVKLLIDLSDKNIHDLVEMMNWEQDSCKKNLPKENNFENLDSDSRSIVETIKKYPEISLDEIFDKTNINSAKLSAILLELEMENIVETLPGDRYRLV